MDKTFSLNKINKTITTLQSQLADLEEVVFDLQKINNSKAELKDKCKIYTFLKYKKSPVTKTEICKRFYLIPTNERDEILNQLIKDGFVETKIKPSKNYGRNITTYHFIGEV